MAFRRRTTRRTRGPARRSTGGRYNAPKRRSSVRRVSRRSASPARQQHLKISIEMAPQASQVARPDIPTQVEKPARKAKF